MSGWEWDETLYAGSAEHYLAGRMGYPRELVEVLREELGLDGTGAYLDVGCGPGSLTMLLAPFFATATGADADRGMLAVASREAGRAGIGNIVWRQLRAEDVPAGLGPQRLITFAQSFHWFEQARVARLIRPMLTSDGAVVNIGATTHQGIEGSTPPRERIDELIHRYLGTNRRAGRGTLPEDRVDGRVAALEQAGFRGPDRIELAQGQVVERTEDQIVASVLSLSGSAPHLYGDRLPAFEQDLRALLRETSPDGLFREKYRDITVEIWR